MEPYNETDTNNTQTENNSLNITQFSVSNNKYQFQNIYRRYVYMLYLDQLIKNEMRCGVSVLTEINWTYSIELNF